MTNLPDPPPAGGDDDDPSRLDSEDRSDAELDVDLDAALESRHDPDLGATLRALLGPADDLRDAARAGVDRTLQGRSVIATATDVAATGWATMWHLLTNPEPEADRDTMRERHDD